MRYLLMLDTPFWMMLSGGLGIWGFSWKRRTKALDEPQLMLPRKERRQWARDEMKERKEDQQREQLERDLGIVHGKVTVDPINRENI